MSVTSNPVGKLVFKNKNWQDNLFCLREVCCVMATCLLLLVLDVERAFFCSKKSRMKTTIISLRTIAVAAGHQYVVVRRIDNNQAIFCRCQHICTSISLVVYNFKHPNENRIPSFNFLSGHFFLIRFSFLFIVLFVLLCAELNVPVV